MDYKEAAKRLGISVGTVYNWLKSGKLEATKTENGEWDISVDSVNRILSKYQHEADLVKVEMQISNYIDQKTAETLKRIRSQAKNFIEQYDQGNENAHLWAQKIAEEVQELNRLRSAKAVVNEAIQDEFTPFEDEGEGEQA